MFQAHLEDLWKEQEDFLSPRMEERLMGNGELVLNWSHLYLLKGSAPGSIGNHSCCSGER